MRFAKIEDGVVTDIIEASAEVGTERGLTLIPGEVNAGPGWSYADGEFTPPPPPDPTIADIDAERDRRIAEGFDAELGEGLSVPVDTRHERDFRNLNGLGTASLARLVAGDATTFTFRGADNEDHELTPAQMNALAMQAMGHVSAHYSAAWVVKEIDPLPADFAADERWP
jgi:hypothetical protein